MNLEIKITISTNFKRNCSTYNDGLITKTEPGATGILVNGVEILNYKSNDLVRYGQIDNIEVVSSGSDYDIIIHQL
ncbi:MAG: hypothetical protein CM15mV12_0130 [uncultured marine virus]|nr:MAG: hypothetical protein CM15mV12_0130 [uncultured marine virus]